MSIKTISSQRINEKYSGDPRPYSGDPKHISCSLSEPWSSCVGAPFAGHADPAGHQHRWAPLPVGGLPRQATPGNQKTWAGLGHIRGLSQEPTTTGDFCHGFSGNRKTRGVLDGRENQHMSTGAVEPTRRGGGFGFFPWRLRRDVQQA